MDLSDFKAKDAYKAVFTPSRLLHSYLIRGEAGEDRTALAETLAAAMICENTDRAPCGVCRSCKKSVRKLHPDIIRISLPDGKKEIPVDTVRDIRAEAIVLPNEAEKKVFIIEHADFMNDHAQNAFLKTLEEPPSHARFILLAENPAALLDTVRSRCAELRIRSENTSTDSATLELADKFFHAIKSGDLAVAEFMYDLEKLDREKMSAFVNCLKEETVFRLRERKITSQTAGRIISVLDKCPKFFEHNVNIGHIAGMICAGFIG